MASTAKAAALGAVTAFLVVGAPADAATVQILGNNAHPIVGIVNFGADPFPGGKNLTRVQNQESFNSVVPWDLVCNTQGYVGDIYPFSPGQPQFSTYSNYNGGCATFRSYRYENLEGYTSAGHFMRHKWLSKAVDNTWTVIGDIGIA